MEHPRYVKVEIGPIESSDPVPLIIFLREYFKDKVYAKKSKISEKMKGPNLVVKWIAHRHQRCVE